MIHHLTKYVLTLWNFSKTKLRLQYLEQMKKGQKQIFYLAEIGKKPEDLAQSVFIEKLHARGYEVLLLTEPLDEILLGHLREWKCVTSNTLSLFYPLTLHNNSGKSHSKTSPKPASNLVMKVCNNYYLLS